MRLAEARVHVEIDVGFGDPITPAATDLEFPTLVGDMPSPIVLAYPTETIVAEKTEAMVDFGISNSRMKDFVAMAARRVAFDGDMVAATRARSRQRYRRESSARRGHDNPHGLFHRFDDGANGWALPARRSGRSSTRILGRSPHA